MWFQRKYLVRKKNELRGSLLPTKSKSVYDTVPIYTSFVGWRDKKRIKEVTEDVVLAFLDMRSQTLAPSPLWPEYSMLKSTLKAKENIDIEKFGALIPYLKKLNVALIFEIARACKKAELCAMKFSDIQDCGDVLNVIIPDSKTYEERRFRTINEGFGVNPIKLYRRYVALRPTNSPLRFVLHYHKGKCSRQNVGINTFRAIPRKIATFLNLENPKRGMHFAAVRQRFWLIQVEILLL